MGHWQQFAWGGTSGVASHTRLEGCESCSTPPTCGLCKEPCSGGSRGWRFEANAGSWNRHIDGTGGCCWARSTAALRLPGTWVQPEPISPPSINLPCVTSIDYQESWETLSTMASLEQAFKRHSRAQTPSVPLASHHATDGGQSAIVLTTPVPALRSDGVLRRSRVLNAQSSPSWLSSAQLSTSRKRSPPAQDQLIVPSVSPVPQPKRSRASFTTWQWLDLLQLGTLVQGTNEWLLCSSRVQREMYMLRGIDGDVDQAALKAEIMAHPRIVAAAFAVSSDVQSFIGFQYVRFTLEEMLYVHVRMDETQIRAVATSAGHLR